CLTCCLLPVGLVITYFGSDSSAPPSWTPPIELPNPMPKVTLPLGKEGLKCLAFAPDGTLAAGYEDGRICVVRNLSMEGLSTLEAPTPVTSLVFASDGATLFSGGGGGRGPDEPGNAVIQWNISNGEKIRSYNRPPDQLHTLALSPDGKWLAAGGRNGVMVW